MRAVFYKQDFKRNSRNTKGLFFIICFRVTNLFTRNVVLKIIGIPIRLLYVFFIQWVLGIDISCKTFIGEGFVLFHGQGLIVNENVIIGKNVTLRHNTTIGNAASGGKCPVIEDGVNVGANCVIIGNVRIGKQSLIGAGSVVVKDVPANSVAVGNPAKVVNTTAVIV